MKILYRVPSEKFREFLINLPIIPELFLPQTALVVNNLLILTEHI